MKKNFVYTDGSTRMVCVLIDKEIACLCQIVPHKRDNGYKIQMSRAAIYSTDNTIANLKEIGYVKNLVYHSYNAKEAVWGNMLNNKCQ